MKRTLAYIIFGFCLAGLALAQQDVTLRQDHPDEYVVQPGDTLWDISGRFLERPWQWPAIWQANPQVDNPHLIYPGDRLSLVWIDGQPRLTMNRAETPYVKLSPQVRDVDTAINTIPLDAIDEFIRRPRVVDEDTFNDLGYIVANNELRAYAATGDYTYAMNLQDARVGELYIIARLMHVYEDVPGREPPEGEIERITPPRWDGAGAPERDEGVHPFWRTYHRIRDNDVTTLGYELWEVSTGKVVQAGEPAVLEIEDGKVEVRTGDFVMPIEDYVYDAQFNLTVMNEVPEGARVLATTYDRWGAGHFQIVALNIGSEDGVVPGHTFSAHRPGHVIRDEVRYPAGSYFRAEEGDSPMVQLPDEYTGDLVVFRAFPRVSYAMMMDGRRPVKEFDVLKHPNDRFQ